jgi:hypothetical protein
MAQGYALQSLGLFVVRAQRKHKKEEGLMFNTRLLQVKVSETLFQYLEEEAARRGLRITEMARIAISEACGVPRGRDQGSSTRETVNAN